MAKRELTREKKKILNRLKGNGGGGGGGGGGGVLKHGQTRKNGALFKSHDHDQGTLEGKRKKSARSATWSL